MRYPKDDAKTRGRKGGAQDRIVKLSSEGIILYPTVRGGKPNFVFSHLSLFAILTSHL